MSTGKLWVPGRRDMIWKQVLPTIFETACEELNGIIQIG